MPELSLPPEALRAATFAVGGALHDEFGHGWNAEMEEALARAALEAALPHLGLPQRRPRIVCPVCTREVVKRDDDTPCSHDVPVERRDLMCEDTFGRCRGGCRCRKCRPRRTEKPNA